MFWNFTFYKKCKVSVQWCKETLHYTLRKGVQLFSVSTFCVQYNATQIIQKSVCFNMRNFQKSVLFCLFYLQKSVFLQMNLYRKSVC